MPAMKRKNEDDGGECAAGPRQSERLLKKTKTSYAKEKRGATKRSGSPVRGKPNAEPITMADAKLVRMGELKEAFGKVAAALKPVLAEVAERTVNELAAGAELRKDNENYLSTMRALDGYLSERKEIEAGRLRQEMAALNRDRLAAESLIKQQYEVATADDRNEYYSEKDNAFKRMPWTSADTKGGPLSYVTIADSSVRYDESIRHTMPNGAFYAVMEEAGRNPPSPSKLLAAVQKVTAKGIASASAKPYKRPESCDKMAALMANECTDAEKNFLAPLKGGDFFLGLIEAADTQGLDRRLVGKHGVKEYFKKEGRPDEHIAKLGKPQPL
ncbi:MAG: hypothetical protein Q9187_003585 [Circinaria calcarea]